jgi:hypothetical protein
MSMMLSPPLIFGRVTFGHARRQCPPENVSLVPVQRKRLVMFLMWLVIHFGSKRAYM